MPQKTNKRTLIIFIGIAVAILIVLTTSTYANVNLEALNYKKPFYNFNKLPTLNELITKITIL